MIIRGVHRRVGFGASAALLVIAALPATACSSDDPAASTATTSDAPTTSVAPAAPRTRHVVVIGLDGLTSASLAAPEADLLAQLAEESGQSSTTAAAPDATGTCAPAWSELLRAGGAADGAHADDGIATAVPGVELGAFVADPSLAPIVIPSTSGTISKAAAVDVPGLLPWPKTLLEVEQVRDAAITSLVGSKAPSVTLVQADLLSSAAADPALSGVATDGADDLVDFIFQAVDGRPHRADEDWLFVISGVCATAGEPVLLLDGDGVEQPAALGSVPPATVVGLVSAYLGADPGADWPAAPDGLFTKVEIEDGTVTS